MAGFWSNLKGTTEALFSIGKGKATLDASGLTAARTHVLPDEGGTLSLVGPAFRAYMSANQTLTASAFEKVAFQTVDFDTASCYDTTNRRWTPNKPGIYLVGATVDFNPATNLSVAIVAIFQNGVELLRLNDIRGTNVIGAAGGSHMISMNGTTDYIEIHAYLNATTRTLLGGSNFNGFYASYSQPL